MSFGRRFKIELLANQNIVRLIAFFGQMQPINRSGIGFCHSPVDFRAHSRTLPHKNHSTCCGIGMVDYAGKRANALLLLR